MDFEKILSGTPAAKDASPILSSSIKVAPTEIESHGVDATKGRKVITRKNEKNILAK